VQQEHEQEPPHLDLEVHVLLADVDPHEVEADTKNEQQDPRDLLEEHEQQHGGHPTSGIAA